MLGNGQMTDFSEQFDQLYVKIFLDLNMIETDQLFLQKLQRGSIGIKRTQWGSTRWHKNFVQENDLSRHHIRTYSTYSIRNRSSEGTGLPK